MNLAVHDMEDRNAWHAHPLACGRPSAQLSGLRTGKRPTSRNTIILCNKVCDGEMNIDIRIATSHVCFTPESGHVQCRKPCLLRANSGHTAHSFDHHIGSSEQ